MPKLTVLITCKNERANIASCIESALGVADELLVADSGSTDGTLEYVRGRDGCRVVEREYVTAGDFRNWAIRQASHPWVLLLDADERVSPELASEIRSAMAGEPSCVGFGMQRRNHLMGHAVRHTDWARDKVVRLFRRDSVWFNPLNDHAIGEFPGGAIQELHGQLVHYTIWSWGSYLQKFDRYTRLQAERWYAEGRRPSWLRMLLQPPLRFLRDYVLYRGFLDGMMGLQLSLLSAFYTFMKQARLWELHHGLKQGDVELHTLAAERRAKAKPCPTDPVRRPIARSRRQRVQAASAI